jgi:hypothetical protein
MSRFATVKSEDARLDSLSDPSTYGDIDENDPGSMARFMKRMGDEMGEDLGEDVDAAMDEAMSEPATTRPGERTRAGPSSASRSRRRGERIWKTVSSPP